MDEDDYAAFLEYIDFLQEQDEARERLLLKKQQRGKKQEDE